MVAIEEKIRHLNKKIDTALTNEKKTTKDAERAEHEIDEFQEQLEQVEKAEKQFEAEISRRSRKDGPSMDESTLTSFHKLKEQVVAETMSDRDALNSLRRQVEVLKEPRERLKRKLDDLAAQRGRLEESDRSLVDKGELVSEQIRATSTELDGVKTQLETSVQDRERFEWVSSEVARDPLK